MKNICEVTRYGKKCYSPIYCLFRRRVFEKGHFLYKHLYVCLFHSRNNERLTDTYEKITEENYGGESSPYWQYQSQNNSKMEENRANPDELSEEMSPYKKGEVSLEMEEVLEKIKQNRGIFSDREKQVIEYLEKNMTKKEIAIFLDVKVQTINSILKRIKTKLS